MRRKKLLITDAVINMLLGLLLAFYPLSLITFLGLPLVTLPFYASILGAVLFGIGIASLIQLKNEASGLGLMGAVVINICGGLCLAFWLAFGNIVVPLKGVIVMWLLVLILAGLSVVEFITHLKSK